MPNAQIPVLIELRRLKDPSNITIQRLVDDSLCAFGLKMDSKVLGELLENGRFAIFLDGLDELAPKTRRALEDAVMEFLKAARRNLLVVSSRPDQRFQGWPHFTQFSVERLGVEEATAIVRKLRIPQELKENFFAAIEKDAFGGKRELLEIPLFVYILILVFRDFAQVPGKIVLFYRFAFDVLYSKHDALKVGFERFRHTDLSIDDMERVVGCFCFITYMGHVFEFDEVKLAGFVREAAEIEQIEADPDDLLRDFMECLCLLQRDGLGIVFTHRTFQEYFCAHYLVNSTLVDLPKTLDDALLRMSNQVIGMAHALAEGNVEDEWLLPKVRQLRDRMELALDDDGAFLAHSSLEVRIDEGRVSIQHSMPYDLFEFVLAMRAFDLPVTILDGTVETVVGVPSSDFCQTASESGFVPINLQKADAASRSRMWLSKKGETQFLLAKEDLGWCDDLGLRNSIRQFRRQLTDAMLLFERAAERRSVGQKRIESFLRRGPPQ